MSSFKDFYKNSNKLKLNQEERRSFLLEQQRLKRQSQFETSRNEKEPKVHRKLNGKINEKFNNSLMLSEWMMETPSDLENFMLVPCPKGIRCTLAIDQSFIGSLYYKNGRKINFVQIHSNIPRDTILDCIYVRNKKIIYVLDVIQYNTHAVLDCDYSFRSFWIRNKFQEDMIEAQGNIALKVLNSYDFGDSHQIHQCFNTYPLFPDDIELDGFLFYHKEGCYVCEDENPLVLWLFPFMIEDLLPTFKVHEHYNSKKPENYVNYLQFISDFERKKKRKSPSNIEMDCDVKDDTIELEING